MKSATLTLVAGALAALLVSGCSDYIQYKEDAQKAQCISNLKQIQAAAEQCVLAGKEPTMDNICGPDKFIKTVPMCPKKVTYTLEVIDGTPMPKCPVPGHALPPPTTTNSGL